jgi:transcriptional regulator, PadR family
MYNMHNLIGFQRDLLRVINGLNEPTDTNIKNSMEDYYVRTLI